MYKSLLFIVVFSLNFNSVGKEAFMPSKAKNMPQSCTFLGGGGGGGGEWGSERHAPTLGGAKLFEISFPHFKTSFTQIGRCYL